MSKKKVNGWLSHEIVESILDEKNRRIEELEAELEKAYEQIGNLVESDAPVVTVRIEVVKAEDA